MKTFLLSVLLSLVWLVPCAGQTTVMSGTVTDAADGNPIIGASVVVEGSSRGAITDADGKFRLTGLSAADKRVKISYLGYETKLIAVEKGPVSVRLIATQEMMDEVIVVAFGKQKRESFTGSASVVKAEDIAKLQVNNPIEAMNGMVAGMQMSETNSFTSDPTITIRGIGSLNASTSPLIVVDGLPYNGYTNDLNPADIANVTVLKDAASNALYGARGANGVILITTKSAERGKTRVSLDMKWGANTDGNIDYDRIDNAAEYYEMHYRALRNYFQWSQGQTAGQAHLSANATLGQPSTNGGLGYISYSVPAGQLLIGDNGKLNPAATPGNRVMWNGDVYMIYPDDWREEGLRNGLRQEYNLNLTGGNKDYTFLASLGYLNNEGLCYGTDMERYTARLKTTYQAFPWLQVGANAGYNHTVTNVSGNAFAAAYNVAPIYPLYIRDGEGRILRDDHGKRYDYGSGDNQAPGLNRPVEINGNPIQSDLIDASVNNSNSFNLQGFATVDLPLGLRLTINGSAYITENRMNYATNPYYGYAAQSSHGAVSAYHYRTTDTNYQQLLNYHKELGRHTIDALLGHEYSHSSQTSLAGTRTNVANFDLNIELDGAIINDAPSSSISNYNVEGWFTRAQYDYDGKYFASGSFRRDGSTTFHPDHRWGNFWSLGGAWIMSKEPWFPKNWWLNMLKVKASYGEQGNDGIGNFRYTDYYNITNINDQVAYTFASKGNPDITWETVGCLNAGVEFELFNQRLRGSVEYYHRVTRDMLMWFQTPSSLGYTGYYDNVGDMLNYGIETELTADLIKSRHFSWTVNLNLTWQKNRVTKLAPENKDRVMDGYAGFQSGYNFVGEKLPVNSWMLKQYAGVGPDGDALYYKTVDGQKVTTTYSDGDYYLCGNALPDLFGGLSTSINCYGFDFSAQCNYSIGGKRIDNGYMVLMTSPQSSITGAGLHRDLYNAWTPEHTQTDIPRFMYSDQYTASVSDRFLTDASYFTIKNIQIGYTLPASFTKKWHCEQLRVYFACNNVYYFTARKGFDPRVGTPDDFYYSTSNNTPIRTFTGGISLKF